MAHYPQIQAANAQVVTISFGPAQWAPVWLQETQSPFPLLLDTDRAAYRAYGLDSSARRSWSAQNLLYYAKARLQGRQTYGKRGDTNQLGGDFVIDPQGIIRLAHPSYEPTDRTAVSTVLSLLHTLNQ
ncbi:MAG: redoxin domain-containing protein [Anaerolineales bacterium]|nr:redoxin domain-containing protein [Anaerolineales bacterium]